ncbi:hypothetical protein WJ0W_000903 [Paenibacillus melissococcoides]|uniref:Uncharacterized protein n=1 Tax=Paenibacillus melissococcoides TaxID=2912268 RepID=A0ABM9FWV4_9BACL|nr:hypothetical protein WJ0W_000903 [Paenibacillus melissococcoides]
MLKYLLRIPLFLQNLHRFRNRSEWTTSRRRYFRLLFDKAMNGQFGVPVPRPIAAIIPVRRP